MRINYKVKRVSQDDEPSYQQ